MNTFWIKAGVRNSRTFWPRHAGAFGAKNAHIQPMQIGLSTGVGHVVCCQRIPYKMDRKHNKGLRNQRRHPPRRCPWERA